LKEAFEIRKLLVELLPLRKSDFWIFEITSSSSNSFPVRQFVLSNFNNNCC
jgi:hypothetical protein